jgi:hypothetical protein
MQSTYEILNLAGITEMRFQTNSVSEMNLQTSCVSHYIATVQK